MTGKHLSDNKYSNRLIHESSPYLQQHAHNPVDWFPWGQEALEKAKSEDKPILVSIGYSSCHWCHVMERETFENLELAALMNKYFINIKVDREERPDVDQIYMESLQSMNVQGGWPLNVFLMPDMKPFYGGTYFPPSHWAHLLQQISNAYKEHRKDLENAAEDSVNALNNSEINKYNLHDHATDFSLEDLEIMFKGLEKKFDKKFGGINKAPKFPMPSIYSFLLRYYHLTKNEAALNHVRLTLDKMAYGGIYDQTGGGFARYSTDEEWFAPHFEKMLYDNGQLISLYSEAYALTKSELYKEVVFETIEFIQKEMTSPEGGFYSALDADSEGMEGKYYVWTNKQIEELLDKEEALFKEYYNTTSEGNWEHGYNILNRSLSDTAFANKHQLSIEELKKKVSDWKKIISTKRETKIKPGIDYKILTSWNGIMLKGIVDAYRIFGQEQFLQLALKNAQFIEANVIHQNKLTHTYSKGKSTIAGYLDDYAFTIEAYISLYQATFDEKWLLSARDLSVYVIEHFFDGNEDMFFFTSNDAEKLIARKKEIFDNVIPASNSVMAKNLFVLGKYFDDNKLHEAAKRMIGRVKKLLLAEPSYLANWGNLLTLFVKPPTEIVISGKEYLQFRKTIEKDFRPELIFAGTASTSSMPLLQNRDAKDSQTTIYVCHNRTCKLPVNSVEEALKMIE